MDPSNAYEPNLNDVEEVVSLIKQFNTENSDISQIKLENKHAPVLAFLFSYRGQSYGEEIQLMAANLLKSQVSSSKRLNLLPEHVVFLKNAALNGACAPSTKIREHAANVIHAYASRSSKSWPRLFITLQQMLDSSSGAEILGSFAIIKLFVNHPPKWLKYENHNHHLGQGENVKVDESASDSGSDNSSLKDSDGETPFGSLVNKLMVLLSNATQSTRIHAINNIYGLSSTCPNVIVPKSPILIASLMKMGEDSAPECRSSAIKTLLILMDIEKVELDIHIVKIVEWMAKAVEDQNEEVAAVGCDFWVKFCTGTRSFDEVLSSHVMVLLPQLIKVLVSKMILPLKLANSYQADYYDCGVADVVDHERDKEEEAAQRLRKSAAAALDALSSSNGSQNVLPIVLPVLQARLMDHDVWVRESGILALGVIAECQTCMNDHMLHIFPYLLKQLVDRTPQIRRITCWTLSRYSAWIFTSNVLNDVNVEELIQGLMMRVLDRHKLVQEAACSALTSILGHAKQRLNPYLDYLLRNIMHAFTLYQSKNIPVLCDTIGTLADAVGQNLVPFEGLLVPPLIAKWKQLCPSGITTQRSDLMLQLGPLLECITSVVQGLGDCVQPHGAELFRGAVEVLELELSQKNVQSREHQGGLVCVLDLLASLAHVLKNEFWPLFVSVKASGGKTVFEMINICLDKDKQTFEVRQSACSLAGETAKGCGKQCQPMFDRMIPLLISNLSCSNHSALINNVSWSIGELALVVDKTRLAPHVDAIVTHLMTLLTDDEDDRIAKNLTITIGRLGVACPAQTSLKLNIFFKAYSFQLLHLSPQLFFERETCAKALCMMVLANQKTLPDNFNYFCEVAESWSNMPPDVFQLFKEIFHSFLKENQSKLTQYCESAESTALIQKFNLESFSVQNN
jgi:transportin-1